MHHIAFGVDDVKAETSNLSAQGATVLTQEPSGQWAYIESGGPGSVTFELMPLSSHEPVKARGLPGFVDDCLRSLNKGGKECGTAGTRSSECLIPIPATGDSGWSIQP